jgi:hypothetical protein
VITVTILVVLTSLVLFLFVWLREISRSTDEEEISSIKRSTEFIGSVVEAAQNAYPSIKLVIGLVDLAFKSPFGKRV